MKGREGGKRGGREGNGRRRGEGERERERERGKKEKGERASPPSTVP